MTTQTDQYTKFTDKWPTLEDYRLDTSPDYHLTLEELRELFPTTEFPIPKSVYVSACEHAKLVRNGLRKNTRRTQKKTMNNRLSLFDLWKANGKRCYICEQVVPFSTVNRDHVFPASEGYTLADNMMPACECCNTKKKDDPPTLSQIQQAVDTYEKCGRTFSPKRGKKQSTFAVDLLREAGIIR